MWTSNETQLDVAWCRQFLSVIFRPNPRMVWAGTAEPCAVCRLTAINNIDEEHNRGYTEKIFKFMHDKFGVPGDRLETIKPKVIGVR